MNIEQHIIAATHAAVKALYNQELPESQISLQDTRPEFEGQLTIVVFPIVRFSKKSPEVTANELGVYLQENVEEITGFNVIKGFLNLSISEAYWLKLFNNEVLKPDFGIIPPSGKKVMVVRSEKKRKELNRRERLHHILAVALI